MSLIAQKILAAKIHPFKAIYSWSLRFSCRILEDPYGRFEIYPNLCAGYGLVRGGAGTALVGSHEEVAEGAYWFARG